MKLLVSQKNELYNLIEDSTLSPFQFDFKENIQKGGVVTSTTVLFKNHPFYFDISNFDIDDSILLKLCPSNERFSEQLILRGWYQMGREFLNWLLFLQRELDQEDKWERLQKQANEVSSQISSGDFSNTKFTVQEFLVIEEKIASLKTESRLLSMSEQQFTVLNQKLDEILEQAKSLGRFDWKSLFIGTIISIITQLSVTQENAHDLWQLIKRIFANTFLIG